MPRNIFCHKDKRADEDPGIGLVLPARASDKQGENCVCRASPVICLPIPSLPGTQHILDLLPPSQEIP